MMAYPRSGHAPRTIRYLALWLLVLVLAATQLAVPVVMAAPAAPDTTPAAAPTAPTSTITLDVFAARDEPDADIGPVVQGDAVTSYAWMINEDNTGTTAQRNANPGSGCSPADAGYPDSCAWTSIAGLRSSAPVVAQGDETTLNDTDGITLEPGRYLVSVLADGYKLDGTPFSVPADPGTIEVPLQPLPLPTATATAEVFADVTSANGQYDPGEDGLTGFTGRLADYLGQVNTDVFGNPLCTTYKPGTGPNGYEWADGGPVVLRQGGKCLSGDADMDGVVEGAVGGDDYNAWQASADPAIARGLLQIPNLGPNRYAMTAVPPTGESWVQTTTLEGNHDWDTWLMEGATGYDTEFVVAGEPFPFTIFGYVPGLTSKYQVPTGSSDTYWQLPAHSFATGVPTGSISGVVAAAKVYVPAQGGTCLPGTIWGGLCGAKIDAPIKDGWIALSDLGRGDTAVKLVRANAVTGAFTITGVPEGTYTLTYWDEKQNHILDLVQVTVAAGESQDLGILPLTGWFTKIDGYVFNDANRNGKKDAGEAGVPGFGLTMRKRENSLMDRGTTAVATDSNGYYLFESTYPLTEWIVLEAYSDSFYTTGVTYQADNQPTPTTMIGTGVDVSVLPIIGLAGRIDWGVHAYDALGTNGVDPQNGGIVGSVSYDTTRNELDPQYAAAEDWQPGVSGLTLELHGTVLCGTHPGVPCDARGDYELAPDGSLARGQLLNTYVSETWERPTSGASGNDCLARDVDGDPLVYPTDQQVMPVGPDKGCLEGPISGVQFGTYATDQGTPDANFGAAVDGNYGFGDGCFNGDLVATDPSAPVCAVSGGTVTGALRSAGTLGTPLAAGTLGTPLSIGTLGTPLSSGALGMPLSAGMAASGSTATSLLDPTATFIADGVTVGDLVANTTDGSSGVVASRTGQAITLAAPLAGGTSNTFQAGDEYEVIAAASATDLRDPTATFVADGVAVGDIVTNTTDGSTGTVAAIVDGQHLTVTALSGGTDNQFQADDAYTIIAAGSATDLRDPTATFVADGVAVGDAVADDDGTTAPVTTVVDGQHLALGAVSGGDGTFDAGDAYSIVAGDSATELRDPTATFIADGVAAGDIVTNTTDGSTGTVATVVSGKRITLAGAGLTGGTDNLFQAGDAYTIVAADSATVLRDPTAHFVADGVTVGDTVVNTTDGSSGIVAARTGKSITLAAPLSGGTDFDPNLFRSGDAYVVHATTAAASATVFNDATASFATDGVVVGDPVLNLSDGSTGTVAAVNSETRITLAGPGLSGGTANTFTVGDVYAVGEVAFDALPADGYLVHLDLGSQTDANGDPIYKVTREEDINIGNGDTFVPQVPPPSCAGPLHRVDVAGDGTDLYPAATLPDPSGNGGFDIAVGESTPTDNATFVDIGASPYEGTARPLCDTKLVDLQDGKSIVPMFNVFTDVPLPGRFFFYNVDDLNFSTDPKSLLYGEKAGMPFNPVGIYDWANRLVTTVETDYNGLADVLLPSTNRINCPTPSGVCANLYRFVGNDPGVPGRLNLNYNPQYRTIAAEFEALPGLIVPADTAPTQLGVNAQLPGAQFNGPLVCRLNDPSAPTTPELYAVSKPYVDLRTAGAKTFTIEGQGFGAATGTVALDGVALPTTSWSSTHIDVSVPDTTAVGPHQLTIMSATGATTVNGLTFHVLGFQAFPASGVLDTFTRPNANGLGTLWANETTTAWSIDGNTARSRASGAARWDGPNTLLAANQEAFFTVTDVSTAPQQGLLLKVSGGSSPNPNSTSGTNEILVVYKGSAPTAVEIRTKVGGQSLGSTTLQAAFPATFANGDTLGARALADGTVIAYQNGVELGRVNVTTTASPWPAGLGAGGGWIGMVFNGTSAGNDSHVDDFGGGNVASYTPNLYEVGPGLNGSNQFPAVQYDEGNPPHPVQDALDAAAASPGDDLVVVYPGLATPSNPRLNPRGAYYENLIVHSPVKLQGVGPGSADGSVQGSVIDGSAFGGDTTLAETWRVTVDALARVGNQTVYEGPSISVFASTTSQYGSAFRAGIDGFDVRGADQTNFPGNINVIGGGPTGLPPNVITQGGGIFVNAYARYLQITNNVIESNSGSYAGGIRVGTPNLPEPDTSQHNDHVRIANNRVVTNGGTNLAGGIGLFAGSDGYAVTGNDICGNSSAEYGGGVSVYGYSPNGTIDHNRIWFNASYDEGAGIMIAGELPVDPLILSPGTGPADIRDNLVQANLANDDGGGIRFLMAGNFPMNVVNNMIVNNVSTHEGGGIAIDDAPAVRVVNNTIMNNLTTATAVTSTGAPAPAGLSTGANSALLQATLPVGSPTFSDPLLFNNISWDNRAGTRSGGTVVGLGLPGDATPLDTWDLGVADEAGLLSPTNSVLQPSAHPGVIADGTNIATDPTVVDEFDLSVSFSPWRTNPNFIGALLVAVDAPAGTLGDYHIPGTSPAVDAGAAAKSGIDAPAWDIDDDGRPNGAAADIGADERPGTPAPAPEPTPLAFPQSAVLDAFNRANGGVGSPWTGSTNQNNFRIDGNAVQARLGGDVYRNTTAFGANQEAFLTLAQVAPATAGKQGLILKRTGTGTTASTASLIEVVYDAASRAVRVRTKASGGVLTDRASFPAMFYAGDQLGARALADGTITVFRNGIQLGSVSVPSGTWAGASGGGQVGVRFAGTTNPPGDARFDDFGGGTLP